MNYLIENMMHWEWNFINISILAMAVSMAMFGPIEFSCWVEETFTAKANKHRGVIELAGRIYGVVCAAAFVIICKVIVGM